jgi:hypothetical protein
MKNDELYIGYKLTIIDYENENRYSIIRSGREDKFIVSSEDKNGDVSSIVLDHTQVLDTFNMINKHSLVKI